MKREKTSSGIQRKRSGKRSASPRMLVLRDPEILDLVLQTFEDLTDLRQRCARKVVEAKEEDHLIEGMWLNADQSGLRRWSRLSELVTTNWSLLDQTVRTNQLDPAKCQEAYRHTLWIRTAWTRLDPRADSLALIDQITDHLRQLLIRYAQTRIYRRRPQL